MLDPLAMYDYLALARGRILGAARALSPEQYQQQFPIGPGTLARTLTHILVGERRYVQRMLGREAPPDEQWPFRVESPQPLAALESAWSDQAAATREAIRQVLDWTAPQEYRDTDDDGRPVVIAATAAGQFVQLFQHEVHHRAQAINMLRHLGIGVGDLDFNTLMFERRPG